MVTLGKLLKQIRSKKGMTQKEFSDFLGVPLTTYSYWERDLSFPLDDNLQWLADVLEVDHVRFEELKNNF